MFILDAVANYIPKDEREAQSICERITPRLAHANSAVVLSSVKVQFHSFIVICVSSDKILLTSAWAFLPHDIKCFCRADRAH